MQHCFYLGCPLVNRFNHFNSSIGPSFHGNLVDWHKGHGLWKYSFRWLLIKKWPKLTTMGSHKWFSWPLLTPTGCVRQNENPTNFKIVKELLLVQNHRIHQQKALDFSFNLKPWKWAWHDQEGVTPSRPPKPFFTSRAPTLFAARGRGALLIMPRPLSGSQMKAEIQGFLLMYRMVLY